MKSIIDFVDSLDIFILISGIILLSVIVGKISKYNFS